VRAIWTPWRWFESFHSPLGVYVNRRLLLTLSTAALAAAGLAVPTALTASANHATLYALEIFEPEAEGVPDPLCANTSEGREPAADADLPFGTIPVAVIMGSLPDRARSVNDCSFRVSIGSRSFTVYNSADTRVAKRNLLNRGVRVVAMRDEESGVLVAEKVVGRAAARNEIERAFLATVDIVNTGDTTWTVTETGGAGRRFTFDVQSAENELVGAASTAAIEFDTVAPEAD
jgi:hypothetical protein